VPVAQRLHHQRCRPKRVHTFPARCPVLLCPGRHLCLDRRPIHHLLCPGPLLTLNHRILDPLRSLNRHILVLVLLLVPALARHSLVPVRHLPRRPPLSVQLAEAAQLVVIQVVAVRAVIMSQLKAMRTNQTWLRS
jgi:hypothetical protein